MGDRPIIGAAQRAGLPAAPLRMPIELKVPNAATREAMEASRAILKKRSARIAAAHALIDEFEKARRRQAGFPAQGVRLPTDL